MNARTKQVYAYLIPGMSSSGIERMNQLSIQSAAAKVLTNPEARKLAKRIIDADQRIGAQSCTLVGRINDERNRETMMARQIEDYPPKDAYTRHLKQEALKKQGDKVKALEYDRDELIDTEIGTYEFEKLVRGLLECYSQDTGQRAKDLRRHLEAAKEILETQFSQATAYEQLLKIIRTTLNSAEKLQVLMDLPDDHKFAGELTVTSGIRWIIDALDFIDDLPDSFDKL